MEAPGLQSNFIPHESTAAISLAPRPVSTANKGLAELLLLLAIVLFVASAALAAAVFLYDQYAQSSAASKLDQLKRAKAAFEPALVQQLTRLDDRMNAAEIVLSSHIAPSAFFDALEQSTLSTVSFSTLTMDTSDPQHMQLKMTGVAQSVNSIALQADLFSKSGVIESPIFSDISRQQDGVHFTLQAMVNPTAVGFEHLIAAAQEQSAAGAGATQTQSGTGQLFGGAASGQPAQQSAQIAPPVQQQAQPAATSSQQSPPSFAPRH